MRFLLIIAIAALASNPARAAGNAENGKSAYMRHGCWACHGTVGQGANAGKALAPKPMPFEAFSGFIRHTNGRMPPYQKEVLSDSDLADIHAYLQSIAQPKDYKSIPLLNP